MASPSHVPGQVWSLALLAATGVVAAAQAPPEVAPAVAGGERTPALPFSARAELATSGKPVGVLLHDFDGDGCALLVAATLDPGTLHMWRDPLAKPVVIPTPDYPLGPKLLRLATVDAVVVASRSSEEMLVYSPTAEDPAAPLHRIPLGGRPHALGTGPLLAPETPSVVVATLTGELVVIDHRGTSRTPLLEGLPTFVAVEAGRVIVGSQEDLSARAYSLQPDGTLKPDDEKLNLGGIPRDTLRVETERGFERWIVGGDSSLWRTTGFEEAARVLGGRRIGAVPLDLEPLGRSAPDASTPYLVSLSVRDLSYTVLGEGPAQHRAYTGQDPWGLACGDFDGDGEPDLALANRGARRVSVILGKANGWFHEAARVPVGRGPHALASGDLDGDGSAEVLVIDAMDQELVVLGEGAGGLQVLARHSAAPAGDAVATGDVNGDGNLDAAFLVRTGEGARLRVLFGDGGGALAPRPDTPDIPCGRSVGDLWLGDLDGDGSCDALVADPAGGAVLLLMGSERGLAPVHTLAVATSPSALCVAAGRIFVALGDPGPRVGLAELELTSRNGSAGLAERTYIDMGLAIADLAVLRSEEGSAQVALALLSKPAAGDGAGHVVTASSSLPGLWSELGRYRTGLRPYAITAGDFDGDGYADIFVGAQNSHHVNAWRGGPSDLVRLPDIGAGRGTLDVLLTRLDADGPPTLIVANGFSNDLSFVCPR